MKEISVKLGVVFLITVIFLSINVGVKKDETIKGTETKEKKEEKEEKAVQVAVTIDNNVNYIDLDDYLFSTAFSTPVSCVQGSMPLTLRSSSCALRTPRLAYSRCSSGGRSAGSSTPSTASRRRSCICCFTRISYRLSVFCAHQGTPSALSAPDSPAAPCRY